MKDLLDLAVMREVAAALGMSETASRKRLERARRRLEKELNRTAQDARAAEGGGL